VEEAVVLGADEFDQVRRIAEVTGLAHAGRQVAAQGDDAAATHRLVAQQQFTQLGARAAHAGQVRGGVEAVVGVQAFHRLRRVRQRGNRPRRRCRKRNRACAT
jgi:hypothetical protein